MKSKILLRRFFFLLFILFNSISCNLGNTNKAEIVQKRSATNNTTKQNILFLAIDDLRPMLASYGNNQIKTPNFDRLLNQGVQFNNAYVNIAVCAASRESILTGVRPGLTRFRNYKTYADKDLPGNISLPEVFKNNGYETYSYGKISHHPGDLKGDWTEIDSTHQQFEYQNPKSIEIANSMSENSWRQGPAFEVSDVSDDTYSDGKTTILAMNRLESLSTSNTPFFMTVGYVSPHLPFIQPRKYWDMYKEEDINIAENPYRPDNVPDVAIHNYPELRSMYTDIPKEGPLSDSLALNLIHGYYASVSYTDALIGNLLNKLEELDLRKNTTIVLWGEHGFFLGEHTLWTKHSTFKEAIHVPLIVSSPGMQKGVETNSMTEYVDVYPTLCEIAGIEAPNYLDGKSFVPVLKDHTTSVKSEIYTRHGSGEAVLDKAYSYTEFVNTNGVVTDRMLYDMNSDPAQNKNISEHLKNKEVLTKYSVKLKKCVNM